MVNSQMPVRLGVVDDHNLFRKGLIKLIHLGDTNNKYEVLFEAEHGNDLKEKLKGPLLPDILLMDIDMPDMDGFKTVEWLRDNHPGIHILVVSMFCTSDVILRMLRLGVKGYLSKDIEVDDMHMALSSIANKGAYYSDLVAGVMAQALGENKQEMGANAFAGMDLAPHERQFLTLACTDLTYQQIADKMYLSPKTIDGYREALFRKFQVKNRVALALYAVKKGLVEL
jgi:two-component system invasion response regulator UvrY